MRIAIALLFVAAAAQAQDGGVAADKYEVRSLVDSWLAAQNSGKFADYEKLYADPFFGIRRSGPRVVRLDRAGWLADRQRMFLKTMEVKAEHLRATSDGATIRVRFTQHFASGKYRDVGEKELILVGKPYQRKIGREEMLSSRLLDLKAAQARAASLAGFPLVRDRVVITDRVPKDWAGRAEIMGGKRDRPVWAVSPVRANAVPAPLRLSGTPVKLYDNKGELRCETKLGELEILSRAHMPSSKHTTYWDKSARELGQISLESGGRMLVARIDDAACKGALLARGAALPAPRFFVGAEPRWSSDQVKLTVEENGKPVELTIASEYGWQVLRGTEERSPRLRIEVPYGTKVRPVAADLDGDGKPELIAPGNIFRLLEGFYDIADVDEMPDIDMDEEQGC